MQSDDDSRSVTAGAELSDSGKSSNTKMDEYPVTILIAISQLRTKPKTILVINVQWVTPIVTRGYFRHP